MNMHSAATLVLAVVVTVMALVIWRLDGDINGLREDASTASTSNARSLEQVRQQAADNVYRLRSEALQREDDRRFEESTSRNAWDFGFGP